MLSVSDIKIFDTGQHCLFDQPKLFGCWVCLPALLFADYHTHWCQHHTKELFWLPNYYLVGPHGLGIKNHRGQMLINFCERNGLIVTNSWFRKPKRRLYTWKAPGVQSWHQLDYILVKHQFRNSVKDVQTLPGADIDSDHNLLVAKICTRLKNIIRFQKRRPQWDLEKLYSTTKSAGYYRRETLCNWMWQ